MKTIALSLFAGALLSGLALGLSGCVAANGGYGGGGYVGGIGYDNYFDGAVGADYQYNDFGGAWHARPPYDSGHAGDRGGNDHSAPHAGGPSGGGARGGPPSIPHNPAPERGGGGGGGGGSRGGGGGGGNKK
jgi:hypothetical protein